MMEAPSFWERRWYDQEPACRRLMLQVKAMPQPEIREFCARVLVHFCDRLRKELNKKKSGGLGVTSIGVSAVSSLYHFGCKRRRWYDKNPVIHKAVGMLYTLPSEALAVLGFKLGDTFGLIQVYSVVCNQVEQEPDVAEMARICTTSLQAGKKEAEEVLASIIGKELYQSLSALSYTEIEEPSEPI